MLHKPGSVTSNFGGGGARPFMSGVGLDPESMDSVPGRRHSTRVGDSVDNLSMHRRFDFDIYAGI